MSQERRTGPVGSLLDAALKLLAAAVAVYVGVQVIQSVAETLLIVAAAIGGLVIISFMVRALWRRGASSRW